MYKAVFGLNRKEGTSIEEFERHWREDHAPIGADIPDLKKYTISIALDPDESRYDGTAQLYFEDRETLEKGLDSEAAHDAIEDLANFADTDDILQVVVEEGVHVDET